MGHVIVKAAAFVFIIFLGYGLKKRGFFQPRDFQLLSKIILYITIPAVIVVGFSQIPGDSSLMVLILFGAGANLLLSGVGILAGLKKGRDEQAFNMLNFSGFNIGCFILPYVQSFLGPVGIVSALLFDAGNSFLCTGGTYALAGSLLEGRGKAGRGPLCGGFFFRTDSDLHRDADPVFSGFPYRNRWSPSPVSSPAPMPPLAMLMIGIGLELRFRADQRLRIVRTLALRYAITVPMALAFFFLTPLRWKSARPSFSSPLRRFPPSPSPSPASSMAMSALPRRSIPLPSWSALL